MRQILKLSPKYFGFLWALLAISLFAVILTFYRVYATGSWQYWFLIWNLFLAWLPLIFAYILCAKGGSKSFLAWPNFLLFLLWLVFLPNTFYIITDYVHLSVFSNIGMIYDIVLFGTYAIAGMILGFTSLLLIHLRAKRLYKQRAIYIVGIALFLSGFAIYLGRYLRWNSWDIITNPFGLIFDVSDRVINPSAHPLTFATTLLFFAFLSVIYYVIYQAVLLLQNSKNK